MRLNYEKHQRDYTILASSEVIEEIFSKRIKNFFPHKTHKIFMLVEDGIFYHFVAAEDFSGWPISWLKKHTYLDLKKYENGINKLLLQYRKFLKQRHENIIENVYALHEYMRLFTPVVFLSTYLPIYCVGIDKKIINECMRLRIKYEDVHRVGMLLQKRLLNKLERKLNLEFNSLQNLTSNEFKIFLSTKKLPESLKERKNFMLMESARNKDRVIPKSEAIKILNNIDISRQYIQNGSQIKGNCAYPGGVKGKVKIIKLISEAVKLKKGDILVASMTDPRYVPAMKRAAAIVTDEGGITCHAAIVARELKIPCIVGTKIATKVLRDSQLVRVDANRGIVSLLKK
jgi:phosphohistidine swiveling domain-containing protein